VSIRGAAARGVAGGGQVEVAFRRIRVLAGCYLGLSGLTLVAVVLLRHHSAEVNPAVWTRGAIVAVSALLTFALTARAARGARRAYLRLRLLTAVMVVAIAVIIALPGTFPLWMKIEQGACGVLLLGVATLLNGRRLRSAFAAP
jgi:hypothetical protein